MQMAPGPRAREHWNWAAGAVAAQFVVLLALTASAWASRQPEIHTNLKNDYTIAAAIVSGAALVSLLATWLLGTRSAVAPAAFALLAGAGGTLGYFWVYIVHWSAFTKAGWPLKTHAVALSAIPIILGLLALGLRRVGRVRRRAA
jgi:hypothetical protein